jgi:ketosteroid isomerase-like protein
MVDGNVEIVQRAFDAFSRRDAAVLAELIDPDFVWVTPTARVAGHAEPYRGHEGLLEYLADVDRVWHELRSEAEEFRAVGDRVVVIGRIYAWGVGRVIDAPAGWVWRLRDGRIVEGRAYDSRRGALEAVGLRDEG